MVAVYRRPDQFHVEGVRRRRLGWYVSADGMGRLAPLLRNADVIYDKRYNEWMAGDQATHDSLVQVRQWLDLMQAVPGATAPAVSGRSAVEAREAAEREREATRRADDSDQTARRALRALYRRLTPTERAEVEAAVAGQPSVGPAMRELLLLAEVERRFC